MLSLPKIVQRPEQPYVAIRSEVAMRAIGEAADRLFPQLFAWMAAHEVKEAGAAFIKYNVIDMDGIMELEFGAPTPRPVEGEGEVLAGALPAGRYVSLMHIGHYDGLYDATAMLIGWAKEREIRWDAELTPRGHRFSARLEIYHSDPALEPDADKWETEITIRLAGDSPLPSG